MFPLDLRPRQFETLFKEYAVQFDTGFTVIRDGRVIGMLFGWALPGFLITGDVAWFPWATKRSVLEGLVVTLESLRQTHLIFEFSKPDEAELMKKLDKKYGLVRSVGTVHDMADEPVTAFQTRRPERVRAY